MSLDDLSAKAPRLAQTVVRRIDRAPPHIVKITRAEELRLQLADEIVRGVLPPGAAAIWNPEMTLTSDAVWAAPGRMETSTRTCPGEMTKTRRTRMSGVPKPTSVAPSTRLTPVAMISTTASAPAGSEAGEIEAMAGVAAAG